VIDNDADYLAPADMLAELREDNQQLASRMGEAHGVCEEYGDVSTASLLEVWIDEAERRVWLLYETGRKAGAELPSGREPGISRPETLPPTNRIGRGFPWPIADTTGRSFPLHP
jgi:hypothetical protein